jgi:predicted dehydrogenase
MRKVKELIDSFGPVKIYQARYQCAYSNISRNFWWDTQTSGGPIVEQATHFVDLARFFCGDADLSTVQAMAIKATEPIGALGSQSVDESKIPEERRIPRVTTASWRFKNGAIGTLMHSALLHGWKYETQLEVSGDGYYVCVRDPYDKCLVSYRAPGTEEEKTLQLQDDPYKMELEAFMHGVRHGDKKLIQSSFDDAYKSYELTWAIRRQADASSFVSAPAASPVPVHSTVESAE